MSSTVPKKGNISQFESEIEPPRSLQSTCNASSDLRGFTSSSSPELSELEVARAALSKSFKKPLTIQGSVEETECLQEGFSCTTAVRKEGANFQSSPASSPVALECCYVTLKKSPVASTADQWAFAKSSQKVSGDKYPGTDGSGSEKVQVVNSSAVLPSEVSGVTAGEVTVTFRSSQDKSECNLCVTEMVASSRPNGELCNNTSVSATTPAWSISACSLSASTESQVTHSPGEDSSSGFSRASPKSPIQFLSSSESVARISDAVVKSQGEGGKCGSLGTVDSNKERSPKSFDHSQQLSTDEAKSLPSASKSFFYVKKVKGCWKVLSTIKRVKI